MYQVFGKSQDLSLSTDNKIQAIQIAREWIEAMKNIRDTNIILYWADIDNCWNVLNYNIDCVSNTTTAHDILPWTYYIQRNYTNNRWILYPYSGTNLMPVRTLNSDWSYYQWTAPASIATPIRPSFGRQITISYTQNTDSVATINSNDDKMKIVSLVEWVEKWEKRRVEFSTILTNWKD